MFFYDIFYNINNFYIIFQFHINGNRICEGYLFFNKFFIFNNCGKRFFIIYLFYVGCHKHTNNIQLENIYNMWSRVARGRFGIYTINDV